MEHFPTYTPTCTECLYVARGRKNGTWVMKPMDCHAYLECIFVGRRFFVASYHKFQEHAFIVLTNVLTVGSSLIETAHRRRLVQQGGRLADAEGRMVVPVGCVKRRLEVLGKLKPAPVHVWRLWRRAPTRNNANGHGELQFGWGRGEGRG